MSLCVRKFAEPIKAKKYLWFYITVSDSNVLVKAITSDEKQSNGNIGFVVDQQFVGEPLTFNLLKNNDCHNWILSSFYLQVGNAFYSLKSQASDACEPMRTDRTFVINMLARKNITLEAFPLGVVLH